MIVRVKEKVRFSVRVNGECHGEGQYVCECGNYRQSVSLNQVHGESQSQIRVRLRVRLV